MRRFLMIWLLSCVTGLAVAGSIGFALTRHVDLRFEAFLATLIAPGVNALLLLRFVPELRDERFGSLAGALRGRAVSRAAMFIVAGVTLLSALIMFAVVPRWSFDLARGLLAACAAIGFAAAWRRHGTSGAVISASLLLMLAATSGQLLKIADHVFPSQPRAFRWIVFFGIVTTLVLAMTFRAVERLRDSAPDAATLLEWALAPATAAALIVMGNIFWRPWLTPTWWLIANVLGCVAMGLAFLASLAADGRSVEGNTTENTEDTEREVVQATNNPSAYEV
jgi:hypothetical protein